MKLIQLIKTLTLKNTIPASCDFEVKGIACDSQKAEKDFVFVAIAGERADGHAFIKEALKRGAKAVVYSLEPQASFEGACPIKVSDTRKALAELACRFFGNPSQKLKVIGITGTNGKTTITYLVEAMIKAAGLRPAVIGTINYRFNATVIPAKNTTPGPLELQSLLARMVKEGVAYVALEVSSHALDQERVEGIQFHSAVFTNLTQDHLDYHKDIERYFKAKARLFQMLKKTSWAVVNSDDPFGKKIKELTAARWMGYGINGPAEVMATKLECDSTKSVFTITCPGGEIQVHSRLIGRHNVYNMLASASVGLACGFSMEMIKQALEDFSFVPGRLERIETGRGFSVFVDYAHTPDALFNVLTTLRAGAAGKIIAVFGCGGERDKAKRPKMGKVVAEFADYAIVTSDNSRSEDPEMIIKEITSGMKNYTFAVEPDRRQAIQKALQRAGAGDIVLVAGKGHEDYQLYQDKAVHFSDREVVQECLGLKK